MTHPLFLVAAVILLAGWLPLIWIGIRREAVNGLVALEIVGTLTTLTLVCLTVGTHRSTLGPVALISALCTIVGGLVFARFLRRQP